MEQAEALVTPAPSDKPQPIVAEAPKTEEPPKENPVKEAEQSAIKQRLAETENAAKVQQAPPPPPVAEEPEPPELEQFQEQLEQAIAPLPTEEAKHFFRMHPEFLYDPEQQARANH